MQATTPEDPPRTLTDYVLLGRSGLRVSPLCLGTMTFGTEFGWGDSQAAATAILERYLDAGGNFIDTADFYTGGTSERILGEHLEATGRRDDVVLATKFTLAAAARNPNAGGNGRVHAVRALEASLERLRTDHVDLYWLHAWDVLTPVEEVVRTLDQLVRSGKTRYVGLSDVPAWYFARAQSLAAQHGLEPICGLQLEYSLLERSVEREHVPAAIELGAGLCPWSPLASGLLTGKYARDGLAPRGEGRLTAARGDAFFARFLTDRNWTIVAGVQAVARELGRPPAEVALAWVAHRPGVVSTIVGASRTEQLDAAVRAIAHPLPRAAVDRLDAISRPVHASPYDFFEPATRRALTGGAHVRREPAAYRGDG